jgi:hypothetical protein
MTITILKSTFVKKFIVFYFFLKINILKNKAKHKTFLKQKKKIIFYKTSLLK